MRAYKLNGVLFTEHEIKLLLTIKNALDDSDENKTELKFPFDCHKHHLNVLQRMARWFLTHESSGQESCMANTMAALRAENCMSFEDMCTVYRACEFFEFALLIRPMYTLLSEEIKHNPEAFVSFVKSFEDADGFTESEKKAHRAELQQMKRVIPKCGLHGNVVMLTHTKS